MAAPSTAPNAPEEDEDYNEQISKNIFATYVCQSPGGLLPHPGDISEASSLAAIRLPQNDYPIFDSLSPSIIETGKLSALQIEGVRYACAKHQELLPNGHRAGFFIGDGAGVGKGRQIAGIILDNLCRGRTKHVWVSASSDLNADAARDIGDLGVSVHLINNCRQLDDATRAGGLCKDFQEGVLFVTYSTLVSPGKKGKSRLQQILEWCGRNAQGTGGPETFEGVLCFDECHRAKNFVPGKESASTKVATNVIELQERMPRARVVYCSATGVSEVGNMAYMARLGLWGPGTAFADFKSFLDVMQKRGVGFLEMLAMEMKSEGKYVARGLSFKDAEFTTIECPLEQEQIATYNDSVRIWQRLRHDLAAALAVTDGSSDVWRVFWSAQQRFFKLLCVSLKVPTVVAEARAAIAGGQCVVIGLQSTGEAATDALGLEPGNACGFISSTQQLLRSFVQTHFPTCRNVPAAAGLAQAPSPGTGASRPPLTTEQLQSAECVAMREALLQEINSMRLPANFLDQLLDELGGPSCVAEMTGRKARIVRQASGHRAVYQLRAKSEGDELDSLNIREKDAFVNGSKLVAIISDAASTGISLHAMKTCKNQRRRVHLTIELPWSADKAIQQLGRSHRSNQSSAPIYKLVTTSIGGENRFAAAVARRLQSLGALTRGDRRAASGVDLSEQNFDCPLGRQALRSMYDRIVTSSDALPTGVVLKDICAGVDLAEAGVPELACALAATSASQQSQEQLAELHSALHTSLRASVDMMGVGSNAPSHADTVAEEPVRPAAGKGGGAGKSAAASVKELGDVRRFLNRILGLTVHRQNLLFAYFCATLQAEIRAAKAEGRYTEGVSDLPASDITPACEPEVLWVDPHSGLKTMVNTLRVDRGVSFAAAQQRLALEPSPGAGSGFYVSRRPWFGRDLVLLAIARPSPYRSFSICRPNTGDSFTDMEPHELRDRYILREPSAVAEMWEELFSSCVSQCIHRETCHAGRLCTQGKRIAEVTILSGSIVRVWGVLEDVLTRHEHSLNKADRSMRIIRVELGGDAGHIVGVRYKTSLLAEVVASLRAIQTYVDKGVSAPAAAQALGGSLKQATARLSDMASKVGGGTTVEPVTPVDPKLRAKAFRPPKTLLSFFQAKPGAAKPPAAPAAAAARAPAALTHTVKAGDAKAGDAKAGDAKASGAKPRLKNGAAEARTSTSQRGVSAFFGAAPARKAVQSPSFGSPQRAPAVPEAGADGVVDLLDSEPATPEKAAAGAEALPHDSATHVAVSADAVVRALAAQGVARRVESVTSGLKGCPPAPKRQRTAADL